MKWYYVENGQQAGPVEDTEFPQLIQSGKLRAETLVWREGMANWEPASAACPEQFKPTTSPAPAGKDAMCAECGGIFDKNDMIAHSGLYICAQCKPVFMQRLSEGGASALPKQPGLLPEETVLTRDYTVDIGGCLRQGWALFKANAGGMIASSLLVYLAIIAANIIPYLNVILGLFLTGPLMGGLWVYFIKCTRRQQPVLGDAFSGFGPRYWQLMLTQLIPTLIGMGVMFFFAFAFALVLPAFVMAGRNPSAAPPVAAGSILLIVGGVVFLVFFVVMIYLNVCWLFALPLAADKGLRFWPALQLSRRMVNKHWWMTFALMIVGGLLIGVGLLLCGVGALVAGPVVFAAWSTHYERVFGELAPQG